MILEANLKKNSREFEMPVGIWWANRTEMPELRQFYLRACAGTPTLPLFSCLPPSPTSTNSPQCLPEPSSAESYQDRRRGIGMPADSLLFWGMMAIRRRSTGWLWRFARSWESVRDWVAHTPTNAPSDRLYWPFRIRYRQPLRHSYFTQSVYALYILSARMNSNL